MSYKIEVTQDFNHFRSAVTPFLHEHADEYSQLYLAAERLTQEAVERNGTRLCTLYEGADVVAVGIYTGITPAGHLSLTEWPEAALPMLAEAFSGIKVERLIAPAATADGLHAALGLNKLLARLLSYAMHQPAAQQGVDGCASRLEDARIRLLAEWIVAFEIECHFAASEIDKIILDLEQHRPPLGTRRFDFWDVDGEAVAMSALALAGSTARIGPVYTPPSSRGKGYAAALVAYQVNDALANGAVRVCLFADAANPVSNKLYQRIGFNYLGEFAEYGKE